MRHDFFDVSVSIAVATATLIFGWLVAGAFFGVPAWEGDAVRAGAYWTTDSRADVDVELRAPEDLRELRCHFPDVGKNREMFGCERLAEGKWEVVVRLYRPDPRRPQGETVSGWVEIREPGTGKELLRTARTVQLKERGQEEKITSFEIGRRGYGRWSVEEEGD